MMTLPSWHQLLNTFYQSVRAMVGDEVLLFSERLLLIKERNNVVEISDIINHISPIFLHELLRLLM